MRLDAMTPVAAAGSNASPPQLARKFRESPPAPVIGLRCRLPDVEIHYAAHIAGYGSIPASLEREKGAVAEQFVCFLDPARREALHRSEAPGRYYNVVDASGATPIDAELWRETAPRGGFDVLGYSSVAGVVARPGRPPLRFAETSQWAAQEVVIEALGEALSPPEFILQNIADPSLREAREARLAAALR